MLRHVDCNTHYRQVNCILYPFILSDVECVDRDTGGDALSRDGGVSLSPLSPEAVTGETRRYWDICHSATYDSLSQHAIRDIKGVHPQLQR